MLDKIINRNWKSKGSQSEPNMFRIIKTENRLGVAKNESSYVLVILTNFKSEIKKV